MLPSSQFFFPTTAAQPSYKPSIPPFALAVLRILHGLELLVGARREGRPVAVRAAVAGLAIGCLAVGCLAVVRLAVLLRRQVVVGRVGGGRVVARLGGAQLAVAAEDGDGVDEEAEIEEAAAPSVSFP